MSRASAIPSWEGRDHLPSNNHAPHHDLQQSQTDRKNCHYVIYRNPKSTQILPTKTQMILISNIIRMEIDGNSQWKKHVSSISVGCLQYLTVALYHTSPPDRPLAAWLKPCRSSACSGSMNSWPQHEKRQRSAMVSWWKWGTYMAMDAMGQNRGTRTVNIEIDGIYGCE